MFTVIIYFFYALVCVFVASSMRSADHKQSSIIKQWFGVAFWWLALSTIVYGGVVILFQDNLSALAYGMIAGRIPLLIALAYIAKVGWTLYFFARPPKYLMPILLLAGAVFVVLHATIWLGHPVIQNEIVMWNVPRPNTMVLNLFFLVSFVATGFILVRDAFLSKAGQKLPSLFLGIGLLFVGVGAAQISATSTGRSIFFQLFTGVGAYMIMVGIAKISKPLNIA